MPGSDAVGMPKSPTCGRRVETGMERITSAVIAVRGERLALTRTRFLGHDQRPEDFHTEAICIIEIDTDERLVARVVFDLNDFESALAELEARYLAGEAAAHARHLVGNRGCSRGASIGGKSQR